MRSGKPQQGILRGRTTSSRALGYKAAVLAACALAFVAAFAVVAPAAEGATLGSVSVAPSQANTWSNLVVTLKPTSAWPADGRLVVAFGPGYDISEASPTIGVAAGGCNGGFTRAISSSSIVITRNGAGTSCTAVTTFTIGNIHQPGAGSHSIFLDTQTATGGALDTA